MLGQRRNSPVMRDGRRDWHLQKMTRMCSFYCIHIYLCDGGKGTEQVLEVKFSKVSSNTYYGLALQFTTLSLTGYPQVQHTSVKMSSDSRLLQRCWGSSAQCDHWEYNVTMARKFCILTRSSLNRAYAH